MFYGYPMYFDSTYILVLIGAVFSLWASSNVNGSFKKYDKVRAKSGLTASQAAEMILHNHGIYDVEIRRISGNLTDNYVPSKKVLNLSDSTYQSTSIAAIGVAAHECGHAIQDAVGYTPLKLSMAIHPMWVGYTPLKLSMAIHPMCAIGSNLGLPVLIAGLIFSFSPLVHIGILLFSLGVLISLITLPVEYNASDRALATLGESGMLDETELVGTKQVLRAAGLTYVAAAASAILSLLRLLLIARRND